MGDYDEVAVASKQQSAVNVEQVFYEVYEKDKLRALHRLIHTEEEFYALVFCRTRIGADRLATKLSGTKAGRANLPKGCPPDCTEQDLTGLNLQAINLSGADLRGANLFVADLRQANLGGANLEGVDLGGAKLHGADLRRANLDGADLRGAKYNEDTIWPTNFNPGQAGAVRGD
jgi:uncharacterized protein YjbI with pentapeptide repeats